MLGQASLMRRNRDYRLIWAGQGLSLLGSQIAAIALPLYVLRATGSPVRAGLVEFATGTAFLVVMLPAGYLADRWSRRRLMLTSDLGSAAVMAAVGVAVLAGYRVPFPLLLGVLAAGGVLGGLFHPAAAAGLRRVVADADIGVAVACNQARNQVVYLCAPIAGGLLFGVSPGLPFLVDAASYLVSFVTVLAMRTDLGGDNREPIDSLKRAGADVVAGIRFLAGLRYVRVCLPTAAALNAVFDALVLVIIVGSVRSGAASASTGMVVSCAAVGSILGTFLVPLGRRLAGPRTLFLALVWTCTLVVAAMSVISGPLVQAVFVGLFALLVPVGSIAVTTALTLSTPDSLQGRVQSATSFTALAVAPLGPVSAGLLLAHLPAGGALLVYAALLAVAGIAATVDPGLRAIPTGPALVEEYSR